MRRFEHWVNQGLSTSELAEMYCFNAQEVTNLKRALKIYRKFARKYNIHYDFDRVQPWHWIEIGKAPEKRMFELLEFVTADPSKRLTVKMIRKIVRILQKIDKTNYSINIKEIYNEILKLERTERQNRVIKIKIKPEKYKLWKSFALEDGFENLSGWIEKQIEDHVYYRASMLHLIPAPSHRRSVT